jgi:SAM-dependent methyltransferase
MKCNESESGTFKKKVGTVVSRLLGSFIHERVPNLPGRKLDLGCGPVKLHGHIGLDKVYFKNVDVICDIELDKLPFENESFDVVYSSNTLEHINNIEKVMYEVWRILKKDGHFLIQVPYFASAKAFQDPTHVRFFTLKTFDYFVEEQDIAPRWYFKDLFKRIEKRNFIFNRTLFNIIIGPVINSSLRVQSWYEESMFLRIIPP